MSDTTWAHRLKQVTAAIVRRRCPKCVRSSAFTSWLTMHLTCPSCGRIFHKQHGSTTGVMQIGSMGTLIFSSGAWFLTDGLTDWSLPATLAAMMTLTAAFGAAFFPYAKLIWESVDYLIDCTTGEE